MQIPAPLEKEFTVPWGGESFKLVIRQAVGADDDALVTYERDIMNQQLIREGDKQWFETVRWEPEKRSPEIVRLTLVSCDLEDKGKPIFTSGMSRKAFLEAWARIPLPVRYEMYKAVLKVNPDWDPMGRPAEKSSEAQSSE